ncbi:MAG TPA: protein-glutamate O-methyltransferase CheR [bacterium]
MGFGWATRGGRASAPVAPAKRPAPLALPGMSPEVFARFSELVQAQCGIKMPPTKQTMLEARLRKRLRSLSVETFEEYGDLVFSDDCPEDELVHLLDAVTTNKTDFFREGVQFEILLGHVLPSLAAAGVGTRSPLRAWSAGCATGEEAWTLAMTLEDFRGRCPEFRYHILATDLSTRVLATAARGVYPEERVLPVPERLRRAWFLRSRDRTRGLVRVAPELRAHVDFRRLNFREPRELAGPPLDLIFCRNVLIYFDKEFQRELLMRFCDRLPPGGHLFLGHTESIHGMDLPLVGLGHAVHRRVG